MSILGLLKQISMNKEQYEENLKRKQEQHLSNIQGKKDSDWSPCLHDSCTECVGTGIKSDGSKCIHYISCQCQKCRITY